ncbi:hypothetical protein NMT12_100028 [metagenome]
MTDIEQLKQTITEMIQQIPQDSESVIPHLDDIRIVLDPNFWNIRGRDPITFLRTRIAPLMRTIANVDLKEQSFVLKCEKLRLVKFELQAIPGWWNQPIAKTLIDEICDAVVRLPDSIHEVAEKDELKNALLTDPTFWNDISSDKLIQIAEELGPLMKYQQSEPTRIITIRMDDTIAIRDTIRYGPEGTEIGVQAYKEKIEKKIKEIASKNIAIQKIQQNLPITEQDIESLEEALVSSELNITEDNLRRTYHQPNGTFVDFIKMVLGLYKFPEPREMIEEAFSRFLMEKNYMNADQINFVRILESQMISKKHIELKDLFDAPFTNLGSISPLPLFEKNQLLEMVGLCQTVEKEVYAKC